MNDIHGVSIAYHKTNEFLYLSNEENSLERIAEKMNYSVSTVSRICKAVKEKILKVL